MANGILNKKKQQQKVESLKYFNEHALEWKQKAIENTENAVNIIKQRNNCVIKVIKDRSNTSLVLDVGCGTGNLVCELAKNGIDAVGIDFAKEMIDIARKDAPERARFEYGSIFDCNFESDKFDVISANGFIEHISHKELNKFLEIAFKSLKLNGSLVLSARNRLFNLFSLNKFTEEELAENNTILLLSEAVQVANCDNVKKLIGIKTVPLQRKEIRCANSGRLMYQFTPAQIINMATKKGFEVIEIYPLHIHGTLPKFKDKYPKIHDNISNILQDFAENNMCLIPQSSCFMIHLNKR